MQFQLSDVMPDRIADEQGVLTARITLEFIRASISPNLANALPGGAETWRCLGTLIPRGGSLPATTVAGEPLDRG
jgi:hypothetical protein